MLPLIAVVKLQVKNTTDELLQEKTEGSVEMHTLGGATVTQVTKPFYCNVSKMISLLTQRESYQSPGNLNIIKINPDRKKKSMLSKKCYLLLSWDVWGYVNHELCTSSFFTEISFITFLYQIKMCKSKL